MKYAIKEAKACAPLEQRYDSFDEAMAAALWNTKPDTQFVVVKLGWFGQRIVGVASFNHPATSHV